MSTWLAMEYRLRQVWQRIPVSARRPLRRLLTGWHGRGGPRRSVRAAADASAGAGFSPPPEPRGPSQRDVRRLLVEAPTLDTGGVEEVVFGLLRGLDRARFDPLVLCTEAGGATAERCRRAGIPVAVLGAHRRRAYARLLDEYAIDLVNTHYADLGPPLAADRGIPVVAVLHNTYVWMGSSDRERLRRESRFVTRYIAVSRAVEDYARRALGLAAEKIVCIPNGIDVARHEMLRAAPPGLGRPQLDLSADDFVFLHVAGVDGRKGHNVILAALAELIQDHPEVKVLSVGSVMDTIYFDRIVERARRWGLEGHFRFVSFTPDLHDLYKLSDAFLLPSLIEGFSLSLLEAAFYGLPIIATRVGGAADVLEGEAFGRLIDPPYDEVVTLGLATMMRHALEERPRHTDALVGAMRDFLARRDHWRTQAARAHDRVTAEYDMARMVPRHESVFRAALAEASR